MGNIKGFLIVCVMHVCVHACARACVRVPARVCVCIYCSLYSVLVAAVDLVKGGSIPGEAVPGLQGEEGAC